jgi:hypothetical protein
MVINRDSLITLSFQLFFIGHLRYNISTVGLKLLPRQVNRLVNLCNAYRLPHIYEVYCAKISAGTVLGVKRIELCFVQPMAIVFSLRDSDGKVPVPLPLSRKI